jgi:hypothetical protein
MDVASLFSLGALSKLSRSDMSDVLDGAGKPLRRPPWRRRQCQHPLLAAALVHSTVYHEPRFSGDDENGSIGPVFFSATRQDAENS